MLAIACGGGGGGGGAEPIHQNAAAALTAAASDVPLAGTLEADCDSSGTGVATSVVDTLGNLPTPSLPSGLPNLSELLANGSAPDLPLLGGLIRNSEGGLTPVPFGDLAGLLPAGGSELSGLPVTGQLPTICSCLAGSLPVGVLGDPTALLAMFGAPTHTVGVIPIFDQQGDPVGSLLATIFGPGTADETDSTCGASGSGTPEAPTALFPVDTNGQTQVGDMLSGLVPSLLNFLDGESLLSGGLLGLFS